MASKAKAKASKGNKASAVVVRKGKAPAVKRDGTRYTVEGYGGLCAFLRGLGASGWKPSTAAKLLGLCPGGADVSRSTVNCQVGAGKQCADGVEPAERHHAGEPLELSKAQLAALAALVA